MYVLFLYVNNRRLEKMVSWGASWSVRLPKYYSGDKIMMAELGGGACVTHGGEERCTQDFDGET
jgi:hypothetical protein